MRLAKKVLSIVLMISMLLGNFFLPVSIAVASTDNNDSIVLLNRGSAWKYLDDGSDQGTAWRETNFDDSSWQSGAAPLGYPDSESNSLNGQINTVISYGSDSSNKYPTTYFRTTFNVDDLSAIGDSGSILAGVDDAAVIYLNGHEIARTNLPSKSEMPEIGYDKYVSNLGEGLDDATEGASPVFALDETDMSYLVEGENVLAAEIHQGRPDSSDVYWDMEFVANTNNGGSSGEAGGSSGGSSSGGSDNGSDNGYAATDLTFAPGQNASELNFAWYSTVDSQENTAVQVAKQEDMTGSEFPEDKAATFTGTVSPAVTGYFSNKVTVTDLEESTAYVYRVGDASSGSWSPVYNFKTQATDSFNFFAVGDPQIGAGGSVTSDTDGWKATLSKAVAEFPETSFLASLGDQVNDKTDESEYTGFFAPPELRSLPLSVLVGNHENGAPNYNYHYNLPNLSDQYGITANTSSDYYFTYGNTLFMVLNTNNSSGAEHDAFMQEAIEATPNAKWKVVMFHQDIYGSADHSTESAVLNLRQALFPVFDRDKIDLVLDGHDHSYTRTYQMLGDQALPGQTVDADGAVVNPIGTLYMTLNSGSGSKYYDLKPISETYAAVREQLKVPTFSNITVTSDSLSISTYRTDTMAVTDTYTIKKQGTQQDLDISQLTISADGDTLATENPSSNVKLSLAAKDSQNADVDLSGAYVLYQTDKPDTLSIAADGTVTVKNKPALDTTAKVWAEVYDGSSFAKSNEVDINIMNPYGLAQVTLDASDNALNTDTPGASVKLSLTGKDTHNADIDLSSATVTYNVDQEGILNIATDGTVTLQNKPDHNVIVNITAEVTLNGITVTSNKFLLTVGAKGVGTEIVAPIKNALDDMEERPDGSLDYDSSDLEITWENPTKTDVSNQLIGLRFADLSIPKGATITNAYIQFSVDEPNKTYNPFDVNIYAEDVVNSAAIQNVPHAVSSRVKTADSVEWKITGTDDASMWKTEHEAGPAEQTPNLASLIQEIVDKDGWNAGNALSFILSGEGNRTAESFEGAGGNADQIPTLHLSFVTTDTISDARSQGAGDTPVTVSGIVTCVNPTSAGSYFIQDGTAGINVYNTSLSPAPQQGDRILVTGPMILFNGLLEIKPTGSENVHILSSGNSLPAPTVITVDQVGDYQSQLIKIRNVTLGSINPSGSTTVTDDAGHSTVIYQMGTPPGISAGDRVNITAIASSYNSPELILRNDADIVKAGSILAARDEGASQTATVTGVVTCVNPTTSGSYFIQDGTAGICVYDTTLSPAPQQGDQIQVTGPMSLYHGLLEIAPATPADYHNLSSGNPLPDPKVVTLDQLGNYQSQLVKLQNVTLGTINNSGNTTITDDSGHSSILYKMPSVSGISEGDEVDITAVVAAYNTPELIARNAADIVKSTGGDDSGVSKVEVLATSDIHGTVYPYDYFSGDTVSEGLAKVSTYVNQERAADPNLVLIDNGDTIQGTPLATYYATVDKTSPNPMISAMAAMHYDTWTLGNHEFNFGLDMLNKVIDEARNGEIHVLSANTYKSDDTNLVDPYYIKTIPTENGDIQVGILGLTTKCIPNWESPENYQDLHFNDLVEEANKWVPVMRDAGADIIVAAIHSGEESSSDIIPENQIKAIAQGVNGIDAIVAGHTHAVIQQHSYTSPDGKTVLVTEPGKWGQYVSKLQFGVKYQDGQWTVVNKSTQAVAMDSSIAADSDITSLVQPNQDATLAYLGTKIGTATDVYSGADQLTAETAIMDLINKVQQQESGAQLSIAAPLSSSALIPEGDVTIKDISSVYVYENFLYSINMTGAQLKKWLEFSARYYKQVSSPSDPITKDPALNIPDYNLDQLYGANYTIDLTQPAGSRIKNLTYNGNPIEDTDVFTVAINNYRYNGGGGFMEAAGLTPGQGAIYDSMKTLGDAGQVRNLLIKYVQDQGTITPTVANNWSITKEPANGDKTFDIVEITDLHGNIGDTSSNQVAGVLAENIKNNVYANNPDRTLILSGGDNYQGTAISNLEYGDPVMKVLNSIGVAASALGNHEFDWGLDKVTNINGSSITADYPILCANLFPKGNTTTPVFDPYRVFTLDGVKVAVVGGITESAPGIVLADNIRDYDVLDNVTYINKYAEQARTADGAQIVIALIHEGDNYDNGSSGPIVDIAKNLVGVDAVLGGHTHDIVSTTVTTTAGKSLPLEIGNCNGKGYIDLKVVRHEDGSISFNNANSAYVPQDTASTAYPYGYKAATPTVDQTVQQIVADTITEEGPILNEVLGRAQIDMDRTQAVSPYGESLVGNWATDVTREVGQAEFGFQNNGGLRCDIPQGTITMSTIYQFMPFDNTIETCDMTGAQLKLLLEQAVGVDPAVPVAQQGGKGIQVSGLKFTYDPGKPFGSKVLSICKSDGTPVDMHDTTQTYKVATNNFMIGGGDGFGAFLQATNVVDTHILIRDALADAVKAAEPAGITAGIEGRLTAETGGTPSVKIAVLSDTHYYDPELGTSGSAFEQYLAGDRKMIAESKAILESTIDAIKNSDAQIVLVSGDLTKDGELQCEQQFAGYLQQLEDAGKKVYVIDGNHDINNPGASSYNGDQATKIAYTTPSDFKSIFQNFGYGEATAVDPNSLSYVVDPIPGLRIIAMDSALYDTNIDDNKSKTEGAFSAERLTWIDNQIAEGVAQGKTVIGMMHHGLTNHFSLESQLFPEYVIQDADNVAANLSNLGMKVVFTGHFHAQDITEKTLPNNQFLFDVETGSLVTYPVPYRLVNLSSDGKLDISTQHITNISYNTGGEDFQNYAKDFLVQGLNSLVPQMLAGIIMQQQPGITEEQAMEAANNVASQNLTPTLTVKDCLVNAMVAQYQGDEDPDSDLLTIYQGMAASTDSLTRTLGAALLSLNTDLLPADNNIVLDLNDGTVEQPIDQQFGLDLEKKIIEVGKDANITLSAKTAHDLYGFDLSFKYDPAMFTFEGVTPNSEFDLGDSGVTHDENGNIRVVGVLKGQSAGINGDVDLVTIKLKAKDQTGLSNLTLLNGSKLSNSSSELTVLEQDLQDAIAVADADVTSNGKTEINDLVMVAKQFGASQAETGSGYQAAFDMNKDGEIDIVDIVFMAQELLGI